MLQEIEQLKESLKQNQIINALEKSFYATGSKAGKDEDGYSYFDLIRDAIAPSIFVKAELKNPGCVIG
ncbi:hypothetical protein [Nostoc sp. UHCC 0252]|uniref:hypothetical protein n=1 Tax=Nostoc sp. UHCC 0252 TaxID=3110241 RepID=UPI002B1F39B7|nr:hypothetical protein [Nostoc sp. UHCC 0252]MEA5606004.1 hypothetical protein [Nostoc sp. UHCC 0252]